MAGGSVTLALLGDTMLGRKVAERIRAAGPLAPFAAEVRDVVADADLALANLECCVSDRGRRWPASGKPFFFRAPPAAVEGLAWLGIDCVTLANNHALDYGVDALADTRTNLAAAGIRAVGAGSTEAEARAPAVFEVGGLRLAVVGVCDHPADFAAEPDRPGVAYADLEDGVPSWLTDSVRRLRAEVDVVLVTPHWGPNMAAAPRPYVRSAASDLVDAGATVVAGHSAHVFHGVAGRGDGWVLYDLGDFVDDYRIDPVVRNDLGLVWLLTLDSGGSVRLRAVPIALEFCYTRLARGSEYAWVGDRLAVACEAFGTSVRDEHDHLTVTVEV